MWKAFIALLALSLLAEAFIVKDAHFDAERWFGFHAAYGFIACTALILIAKALGVLLKKPDRYYDE